MLEQLHLPGIPARQATPWVSLCADPEGSPMARLEGESIYRKIAVRMHADEKVLRLSRPGPSGKGLWMELLCGPQTDVIPGLFRAGEAGLAEQLGWTLQAFRRCWEEIASQGMAKADWTSRLVWVPKALSHNMPASPKAVLHWKDCWRDRLPDCPLRKEACESIKIELHEFGQAWGEAFDEVLSKPKPKPTRKAIGKAIVKSTGETTRYQKAVSSKQSPGEDVVVAEVGESERENTTACESVDNSPPEQPNPLSNSLDALPVNNAAPEGEGEETISGLIQAAMEAAKRNAENKPESRPKASDP